MILNAEQRVAVEYPGHCAIVACPGASKTRALVEKTTNPVATSDFGHLLARSIQAIGAGTASRNPCSNVLVDESQDTDGYQLKWSLAHANGAAVNMLVEDDDPCIFGLRACVPLVRSESQDFWET